MSGIRYKSHIKPCAETSIRYGKNPSVPPARVVLLFRLRGDILFFIERLFLTLWQIYTRGPRDIRTEDVHKRRTRDKRFDREKIQQFFFFFIRSITHVLINYTRIRSRDNSASHRGGRINLSAHTISVTHRLRYLNVRSSRFRKNDITFTLGRTSGKKCIFCSF